MDYYVGSYCFSFSVNLQRLWINPLSVELDINVVFFFDIGKHPGESFFQVSGQFMIYAYLMQFAPIFGIATWAAK
ncbi:MAG: hypothetical protein A2X35_02690 [Elusimicrobia bacterium GWA2_61_42]|nr:MAG: hypothetical protein A2X35_02690 [Elusimicrobia bacterium GWA2_61_42]